MTEKRLFYTLLVMVIFSVNFIVNGIPEKESQPGDRAMAIRLFSEKKFADALPHFTSLCRNLPYDFMIKYYYGACLVETGQFLPEAETNLVLASSSEDVPLKVNYYLGRYHHGRGNWNNALRYYNRFKNNAGSSEVEELKVDDLIRLCYSEENPFEMRKDVTVRDTIIEREIPGEDTNSFLYGKSSKDTVKSVMDTMMMVKTDSVKIVAGTEIPSDTLPSAEVIQADLSVPGLPSPRTGSGKSLKDRDQPVVLPEFIDFLINENVTYLVEDMFRVQEAKNEFRIAAEKENYLDSQLTTAQLLRKQYHQSIHPVVRDSLASVIQNIERKNLILKTEVDDHYGRSRQLEQEWWSKASFPQLEEFRIWKDSLVAISKIQFLPVMLPDTVVTSFPDSLKIPEISDSLQVVSDSRQDDELVYKIQIGAYNKGIPYQRKLQFDKLSKIRIIDKLLLENGITIYSTGNLKNYDDALKLLSQIKLEGIKDAFVIAVENGKKVPLPEVNHHK